MKKLMMLILLHIIPYNVKGVVIKKLESIRYSIREKENICSFFNKSRRYTVYSIPSTASLTKITKNDSDENDVS